MTSFLSSINQQDGFRIKTSGVEKSVGGGGRGGAQTEAGWTGYAGTEGPNGLGGAGRDRIDESGEEDEGALDLHTRVLGSDELKNMLVD